MGGDGKACNQSSDSQARGYLENIASARTKAKGCVIRVTKTNRIKYILSLAR